MFYHGGSAVFLFVFVCPVGWGMGGLNGAHIDGAGFGYRLGLGVRFGIDVEVG